MKINVETGGSAVDLERHDRQVSVVVRCTDTDDVIRSVRFATEHNLAIAVRRGGQNIAGNAVGEGGL